MDNLGIWVIRDISLGQWPVSCMFQRCTYDIILNQQYNGLHILFYWIEQKNHHLTLCLKKSSLFFFFYLWQKERNKLLVSEESRST